MLKKITYILSAVMLCSCVLLVPVFESKASASGEYYVPYSEPTANDKCGYLNVDSGDAVLYTYFWNLTGSWATDGTPPACEMYVRFSGNDIIFHPYVYGGTGSTYLTFGYYDSSGMIHILYYGGIGLNDYEIIQNFWAGVKGISFGGNCSFGTQGLNLGTPLIHWNDSVDAQNLNTKLNAILNSLSNIDGDASTIINKLQDIYNQDVSINSKLSAMNILLNDIKSEQKQTNTWLEKIFNYLNESQEKQKQEAQTQGNSSVSQGSSAIEDKGGDFAGSLSGLTNSMSYTGTDCSWTFPTVKLPAIAGVMDEVTLIESQPIDFSFWVNAIPSGIMLIIQSVLTIGLIVYCFKELYSTIAYVLTLRKDDNS